LNGRSNHCSSSQAAKTASPALQKPLQVEVQRLRSFVRLAAMVPTTTPNTSAGRASRPNVMRIPAATPDAGQNTATSVGVESKETPSFAAKKYVNPTAHAVIHGTLAALTRCRSPSLAVPVTFKAPPIHRRYVQIVIGIDMQVDQVMSVVTLVV